MSHSRSTSSYSCLLRETSNILVFGWMGWGVITYLLNSNSTDVKFSYHYFRADKTVTRGALSRCVRLAPALETAKHGLKFGITSLAAHIPLRATLLFIIGLVVIHRFQTGNLRHCLFETNLLAGLTVPFCSICQIVREFCYCLLHNSFNWFFSLLYFSGCTHSKNCITAINLSKHPFVRKCALSTFHAVTYFLDLK